MKKGQIIKIKWNDTYNSAGWWEETAIFKSIQERPYMNETVGHFVMENETWIAIASSYSPNSLAQWGNVNYIPKGCIISQKLL